MIIIRCNAIVKREKLYEIYDTVTEMAKTGIILLPSYCELLTEVPHDTEVVVVKEKE